MSFFFFQAEDGIRDVAVTGVQTCALPIFVSETSAAKAVAVEIAVEPALESARAVKAAAVKPVKPRGCADKHATRETLGSIKPAPRAGARGKVIVAVRPNRGRAGRGGAPIK